MQRNIPNQKGVKEKHIFQDFFHNLMHRKHGKKKNISGPTKIQSFIGNFM